MVFPGWLGLAECTCLASEWVTVGKILSCAFRWISEDFVLRPFFFLLLILLVSLWGCEDGDSPTRPQEPSLSDPTVPEVASPGQTYLITVRAEDPQGVRDVATVTVQIKLESKVLSVDTLFDDGAYYHPGDGDVVAGDGLFSQRIRWDWAAQEETTFALVFQAVDRGGHASEPLVAKVKARQNAAPVILRAEVPEVLPSGFPGLLFFRVQVQDSQGVADVEKVLFALVKNGRELFQKPLYNDGTHGDHQADDDWFELGVDSSFGAGKVGDYTLRFHAEDRLGAVSDGVEKALRIENGPPRIAVVDCPDTVAKPESGAVAVRVTATVFDPQSLADVKSVGFTSLKPDSTYANNGQPIPMADNGLPFDPSQFPQPYYGDEQAGDGVFTFTMVVYSDAEANSQGVTPVQPGVYRFTFQAEDWVGNRSEPVVKILVIRQ